MEESGGLPSLFYPYDLVLCGKSESSLRRLLERSGRVCKRRDLSRNVDKGKGKRLVKRV